MTIKNFEAHVPSSRLTTARDYFSRGKIMELAESRPGHWTAAIWGKRYFEMTIKMKGATVSGATCECESSGADSYCTHLIAMLFAIRHAKGLIADREAFVGADPGAKGGKRARESDKDAMARYAQMVREPFNQAKDITGHIYRDQTGKVFRVPNRLLEEAKAALKQGNLNEAVNITVAVIETVYYCSFKLEHGDNSTLDIFYNAFDLLTEILHESPPPSVCARLYEHGVNAAADMRMGVGFYHEFWMELLVKRKLYEGQDDTGMQRAFNALIRRAMGDKESGLEKSFQELKAIYLADAGKTGQSGDAPAGTHHPAIAAPAPKHGQDPPGLVKALAAAKKERDARKIEMYQQCILNDRRNRNDKMGVREIALELFRKKPTDTYLDFIRETYTAVEWEKLAPEFDAQRSAGN